MKHLFDSCFRSIILFLCCVGATFTVSASIQDLRDAFECPLHARTWLPVQPVESDSNIIDLELGATVRFDLPALSTLSIRKIPGSASLSLWNAYYSYNGTEISESLREIQSAEDDGESLFYTAEAGPGETVAVRSEGETVRIVCQMSRMITSEVYWQRVRTSGIDMIRTIDDTESQIDTLRAVGQFDPVSAWVIEKLLNVASSSELSEMNSQRSEIWSEYTMMRRLLAGERVDSSVFHLSPSPREYSGSSGVKLTGSTSYDIRGPALVVLDFRGLSFNNSEQLREIDVQLSLDDHPVQKSIWVRRLPECRESEAGDPRSMPRKVFLYVPAGDHSIKLNPTEVVWVAAQKIEPKPGTARDWNERDHSTEDVGRFEEIRTRILSPETLWNESVPMENSSGSNRSWFGQEFNSAMVQHARNEMRWVTIPGGEESVYRVFPKGSLRSTPATPDDDCTERSGYYRIESGHDYTMTAEQTVTDHEIQEVRFIAIGALRSSDIEILVDHQSRQPSIGESIIGGFTFTLFFRPGKHQLSIRFSNGDIFTDHPVDGMQSGDVIRKCALLNPGRKLTFALADTAEQSSCQLYWSVDTRADADSHTNYLIANGEALYRIQLPEHAQHISGGVMIPTGNSSRVLILENPTELPVFVSVMEAVRPERIETDHREECRESQENMLRSNIQSLIENGRVRDALQTFAETCPQADTCSELVTKVILWSAAGHSEKALDLAKTIEDQWIVSDQDFLKACVDAALDTGKPDLAEHYIHRAQAAGMDSTETVPRLIRCYTQAGWYEDALKLIDPLMDPVFEGWSTDMLRKRLERAVHANSLPIDWAWSSPNPRFKSIAMLSDQTTPETLVLHDDLDPDNSADEGLQYCQTEPGSYWSCEVEGNRTLRLVVRPHVIPGQSSGSVVLQITIDDRKLLFHVSTRADRESLRYRDIEQPFPGVPETIDLPIPQDSKRILINTVAGSAALRASIQVPGPDDWPGETGQDQWTDRIDRLLTLFTYHDMTDRTALTRYASALAYLVESRGNSLGSPIFNNWLRMVSRYVQWKWISGLSSNLGREKIDEFPEEDYRSESGMLTVTLRNKQTIGIHLPDGITRSAKVIAEVESVPLSEWRVVLSNGRDCVGELNAQKKMISLDCINLAEADLSLQLDARGRGAIVSVRLQCDIQGSNLEWPAPVRLRSFTRFDRDNPASIEVLGPAILDARILTENRLDDAERIVISARSKYSGSEIIRELKEMPDTLMQTGWNAATNTLVALPADEIYQLEIRFEGSRETALVAISGAVHTIEPDVAAETVNLVRKTVTPSEMEQKRTGDTDPSVLPEMRWHASGAVSWVCELNGFSTSNGSVVSDSEEYGTDGYGVSAGLRKRFESIGLYIEQTFEATYLTDQSESWLPGIRNRSSTRPLIWEVRPSIDLSLFTQSLESSTEYAFRGALDIRRTFRLGSRARLVPGIGFFLKDQSLTKEDVESMGEIPDWRIFNDFDERNLSGLNLRLYGAYDILDGFRLSADIRSITGSSVDQGFRNIWWNAGFEWFTRGFLVDLAYQERHPIDQTEDPDRARISGSFGWYYWVTNDLLMRVLLTDRFTFDTEENTFQVGISLHFSRGRLLQDLDPNRLFCWDRIQSMAFEGGAE